MIEPYLSFQGCAGEAIDFYEQVFAGTGKKVMRFSDLPPDPAFPVEEGQKDWVVHADLFICGTVLHFSDMQSAAEPGNMVSLSVRFGSAEETDLAYRELAKGGEILMELGPAFFAKAYAWVRDRFGIGWQLLCE